ncbi:MAG: DNA-binding domain-containing protein [Myxococcales bacterium]|nr:DNA-binding domain-containing protein [Myxococcales bacterium]
MTLAGPAWLAQFQRDFSDVLRTPLDRRSRTLRARPEDYPRRLLNEAKAGHGLSPGERLAVYQRQYWFRLFAVMQNEYRLVAALAGAWGFNGLVAGFLEKHPPRGHDLGEVALGFDDWLAQGHNAGLPPFEGAAVSATALVQAARIDAAYRAAFWAPEPRAETSRAFQRVGTDQLATGRLRPSGRFFLVEEDWPLLALRSRLTSLPPEAPVPLPPQHPRRVHAALVRGETGPRLWLIDELQARLYERLSELPLAEALAALEREAIALPPTRLSHLVKAWLAESVKFGFWEGVDPC